MTMKMGLLSNWQHCQCSCSSERWTVNGWSWAKKSEILIMHPLVLLYLKVNNNKLFKICVCTLLVEFCMWLSKTFRSNQLLEVTGSYRSSWKPWMRVRCRHELKMHLTINKFLKAIYSQQIDEHMSVVYKLSAHQ
jgi:hypothetical protein